MIWKIIKTAMIRADIRSIEELAFVTGINSSTLQQTRRKNPKSFRLYELLQIDRVLKFTNDEWLMLKGEI